MREITFGELAQALEASLFGDPSNFIAGIAELEFSGPGDLTFVLEKKAEKQIGTPTALAYVTHRYIPNLPNQMVVLNPRKALFQAIHFLYPNHLSFTLELADHSTYPLSTQVLGASICRTAKIGENCRIWPGVSIGSHCVIGDGTTLHPNVTLYNHTQIGKNAIIHSGAVIGGDGFGYYEESGKLLKIPHVGRVEIGDDVEIGSGTTIDRGCLGVTSIGRGTKIDNLVHIGHNVRIGSDCALAGHAGISGSVRMGNGCHVGGQVGFSPGASVGDRTVIAGRSGITKRFPGDQILSGFPARDHRKDLIHQATLERLVRERNSRSTQS